MAVIAHTNPGMKPYEDFSKMTSYVWNGTDVVAKIGAIEVMVSAQSDLAGLAEKVAPGTIAYTSGWANAWQLGSDGSTWTALGGA